MVFCLESASSANALATHLAARCVAAGGPVGTLETCLKVCFMAVSMLVLLVLTLGMSTSATNATCVFSLYFEGSSFLVCPVLPIFLLRLQRRRLRLLHPTTTTAIL